MHPPLQHIHVTLYWEVCQLRARSNHPGKPLDDHPLLAFFLGGVQTFTLGVGERQMRGINFKDWKCRTWDSPQCNAQHWWLKCSSCITLLHVQQVLHNMLWRAFNWYIQWRRRRRREREAGCSLSTSWCQILHRIDVCDFMYCAAHWL